MPLEANIDCSGAALVFPSRFVLQRTWIETMFAGFVAIDWLSEKAHSWAFLIFGYWLLVFG
jgi:hypothetical protein